jgi:MYXO-CTERM domain-containing protein
LQEKNMKRLLILVVLAVGVGTGARRADACGGFFCSQVPIDQSGEQIAFSLTDTHVTAHIQISFTGNAKDFAWVVPVQTKPTLSVGTQALFTALAQRTQPVYQVDWNFASGGFCGGFDPRTAVPGAAPAPTAGGDSSVTIVDMRQVGPYDTVTLESTDADALVKWLNKNGFDQPPSAVPLISHYVKLNMFFVALRLKQDAGVGDIQPIVLDMDYPEPCVPLILTRVAAVPNMPVLTYVLGNGRAFPKNWFHVQVNQKKINWLDGGSNYKDVVTAAINEAAGHGFVTEYAGPSATLKSALYREGQYNLAQLRLISDPAAFVQALLSMGFPRDATMQGLLRKYIPMPESLKARGVTEMAFYNNLRMYQAELSTLAFDPVAFAAELDERVIMPLKKAQAMIDAQPYLTRLYSTVSPEEMTRDPFFLINAKLPAVSNLHRAKGTGTCLGDGSIKDITLTLEDGEQLMIPGTYRRFVTPPPVWAGGTGEAAARRIELVSSFGDPAVYNGPQARLADHYLDTETPEAVRARRIPIDGVEGGSAGGGGCSVAGGGAMGAVGLLLVVALVAVRRRRR